VEEDIAVELEEGRVREGVTTERERYRILRAFVVRVPAVNDVDASTGERSPQGFFAVPGCDHEPRHAVRREGRDRSVEDALSGDLDERLRPVARERAKTRSDASGENDCNASVFGH